MPWKMMMILSQGGKRGEQIGYKRRRIKSAKTDAAEKGCTYDINILDLADTVHEAENESVQGEDNAYGHDSE